MKKQLIIVLLMLMSITSIAQTFSYQGVARDNLGDIISNQNIGVQMSVRQGGAAGTIVYQELHAPMTNEFGLFETAIGGGTPFLGTFNTIDWSLMNYWIEVSVDFAGGVSYTSLGATEFQSVPYAMYAASSPDDQNITGSSFSGTNLVIGIEGGNSQTVSLANQGLVETGANNMQPYLTIGYYIALTGIYPTPSRVTDPAILNDPNVIPAEQAQSSNPYIGQLMLFAGNFTPAGWARCDGQLLAINTNTALFSLIGTTYGGDGATTFALPDLRGRAPIHSGSGPGLSNRVIGSKSGSETVTN